MVTEDEIREVCLSFPEAVELPYEHLPSFRVRKKLFARIREEPYALVAITVNIAEKEELIREHPNKYFQTPHYVGYPAVLARPEEIDRKELEELIAVAWTARAPARLRKLLDG